ncbi:DNA topoisomerase IB [Arthrobacter silvisoli]|uniref:DNA topoisomerase IB n=1 Tax=Arthrobacter silvisoli TaxID=2291022 RepID=UPI000E213474|nr:DNA topoisomerase IB [Arthrobacter silvisoli]
MPRLKHSDPAQPGIRRRRAGRGFSYRDAGGSPVSSADRERINGLVIPPAWRQVWICPFANGHIQATGLDGAGRLQYLYHPRWRDRKDAEKFARAARLGMAMPRLRKTVARHLRESRSGRTRTLAAAVRLMDLGALRIGDESYRKRHGSHGLTTLRCRHVSIRGDELHLKFPGKSGQLWECTLRDHRLAAFLLPLAGRAADEVLLAFEDDGSWNAVGPGMLNDYIRRAAGDGFTAKDLRTWKGTMAAARVLARTAADVPAQAALAKAFGEAAALLGNTAAVARDAYVDPRLVEAFLDGSLHKLKSSEAAVAKFLADEAG